MEHYAFYSFATATAVFSVTLILSLWKVRLNAANSLFLAALTLTLLWVAGITYVELNDHLFIQLTLPLESIRDIAWFCYIAILINEQHYQKKYRVLFKHWLTYVVLIFVICSIVIDSYPDFRNRINLLIEQESRLYIHVIFSIIGLTLIEQLYRNASLEQHWSIKFLCLGLGAMFISDFLVYSKSLLFSHLDYSLWSSRGFINAAIAPLLYISFQRLQNKTSPLTISRKVAFHSMMLFSSGLYLIVMSLAGFYIRDFGGEWGEIAQILFIFLTVIILLMMFISGKTQARAKVFINKHFFHYNYDYREEWIKLSKTLATLKSQTEISTFIIDTVANLVDSTGGELWIKNEQDGFYLAEALNPRFKIRLPVNKKNPIVNFMIYNKWIIDFEELLHKPEKYKELRYDNSQITFENVWILVPFFQQQGLIAFVALNHPRTPRHLNWEDYDILETVAMQLSNALMLCQTSNQLARSRQFEAYNRLSAYLVHDLKNLVAQISLIVKNAEKHKNNPEFIDDAILTLQNVDDRMQHLVTQLKQGNKETNTATVDLLKIADIVIKQQSSQKPTPKAIKQTKNCLVNADKNKIVSILAHLIQNAQEACSENGGEVKLIISKLDGNALIQIIDNGIGMDTKFISERLFEPFDTTKGNAGMGIGVYEARDYISKLSGSLSVESKLDVGTKFNIQLPLVKPNI